MSATNIDIYLSELEVSKRDIKGAIQAKGVTPTGGLSSYAEAILSIPTGTEMAPLNETITESGVYNYNPIDDGVGGYNSVEINVDIPIPTFETQSKEVTIKKNGTTSIVPDSGYDGLSKVDVTVQVASTTGKPQIFNGFAFTGGDIAQVDFSQYDWSLVYDTSEFFKGCTHSTGDWSNFEENFNGEVLSGYYMFQNCSNLTTIPNIGYSIYSAEYMFSECYKLTTIPPLDTSNVTNMGYMFNYCRKLTSIPSLDTSNVTSMTYMFRDCDTITTIPPLDTSKVISMTYMFRSCDELITIPQLDTSKVISVEGMFKDCRYLTELPDFNCVKVTNFGNASNSWLYYCFDLQKIGVVDCDSVTDIGYFFGYNTLNSLTDFGGCRNLGKTSSVSNTNSNYFMNYAPNLTYESVMNVINGLYDRAAAGLSVLTLKLHANHLAMLSADDIAIATNKGWTLV